MLYSLAVWFLVAVVVVFFFFGRSPNTCRLKRHTHFHNILGRWVAFVFVVGEWVRLLEFCLFTLLRLHCCFCFVFFFLHRSSLQLRYFCYRWGTQRMARIFKVVATMKCVDKYIYIYIRVCLPPMSGEKHFTISQSVYKIERAQREKWREKKIILFAYVVSPYRIRCINGKPHTRFPAGWRSLLSTIVNIL